MNPDISGAWHGALDTGFANVTMIFDLIPAEDGGTVVLGTRNFGDAPAEDGF